MGALNVTAIVCAGTPEETECALASVHAQERPADETLVIPIGDGAGAARAAALRSARGELVAWCDPGEEWTPGRLAALAAVLERRPDVDLVYGDAELFDGARSPRIERAEDYDFLRMSWWGISPRAGQVVFRASAARTAGGFDPDLRRHGDLDLWLRMSRQGLMRRVPTVVTRRAVHSEEDPGGWEEWSAVLERHYAALLAEGPAALHDLQVDAARPAAYQPATWCESGRELVVCATPFRGTGYGEVARALLRALPSVGVTPLLAPTGTQFDEELSPLARGFDHWGRWGLYYHVLSRPGALPCARRAVYTMWETTEVPRSRIDELNDAAEVVFVPCAQNARAFVECGLERPVRVLHHGVDPDRFPVLERPAHRPFTFGTLGDLRVRKGVDVLVRAFREEFATSEDVALVLRSSTGRPAVEGLDDPRIQVQHGTCDHRSLLATLGRMDAFVLPSRGEGFGLCGLEAAATGLPLIATDWSGPAEYVHDVHGLPLRYALQDAGGRRVGDAVYDGIWAEPDVEHLRQLLRELAEDRAGARERGRRAAEAVRARWTWQRPAAQLRDELDARSGSA